MAHLGEGFADVFRLIFQFAPMALEARHRICGFQRLILKFFESLLQSLLEPFQRILNHLRLGILSRLHLQ
jgi:hypothetical protein